MSALNLQGRNLQGTESAMKEFAWNGIWKEWNLQGMESARNGICRERILQGIESAGNGICREWNLQGMEPKYCHFIFCLIWITVIMLQENF